MRVTILLFASLCIATFFSVRFTEQYQQSGPDILKNGWLIPDQSKDVAQDKAGVLSLYSLDAKKNISIHQNVKRPYQYGFVSLEADMMYRKNMDGKNGKDKALLFLVQYNASGKALKTDRIVTIIDGAKGWKHYKKVFKLSPEAAELKIFAQLIRSTGTLQLKKVCLYPVIETSFYPWIKKMVLGTWGLFFVSLLASFKIKGNFWVQVFFVTIYGGILFATSIPDDMRNRLLESLAFHVRLMDMSFIEGTGLGPDEMGHLLAFTLYGIVLSFLMPKAAPFVIGMNVLMLAVGTEAVQIFIESRTPNLIDVGIDLVGGITGAFLVKSFFWVKRLQQI